MRFALDAARENGRDRGGACRLAGELRVGVEPPHRLLDLLVRDDHDLDAAPRRRASALPPANGASSPPAIVSGITATGSPASSAERSAVDPSGSTATTRTPRAATAAAIPAMSPPPPTGNDDRVDAGRVLEDLEPDRALAGDHERVVERVDERRARLGEVLVEPDERLGRVRGLGVDRRAERPRAIELERARGRPLKTSAVEALVRSAPGERDRVVPGGRAATPRSRSPGAERGEPVGHAPRLERARALEQLRLERQAGREAAPSSSGVRRTRPRIVSAARTTSSRVTRSALIAAILDRRCLHAPTPGSARSPTPAPECAGEIAAPHAVRLVVTDDLRARAG